MNYNKIMLLGDLHGDYKTLVSRVTEAAELNVPIFQLGDFGYWRHTKSGAEFFDQTIKLLEDTQVDLFFIRGNHELTRNEEPPGLLDLPANCGEAFHLFEGSNHLYYVIDGIPWEMSGKTFIGIGGAHSIDHYYRVKYVSWWPEEDVSQNLLDTTSGIKADFLLSHETIEDNYLYEWLCARPIERSTYSRKILSQIVNETLPDKLFHGHWHIHYDHRKKLINDHQLEIVGLADSETPRSTNRVFLNVETGKWGYRYEEI